MLKGKLWLDFENEYEEAHYVAEVSQCIIRENELILEFSGRDEGHNFSGNCTLSKSDASYSGKGKFKYEGASEISSDILLSLEKNGSEISIHGTWRDEGETETYKLEVEISES